MAQAHVIADWSGGLNNSKTAWELAENESPDVQGFIGEDGPLTSISGPLKLGSAVRKVTIVSGGTGYTTGTAKATTVLPSGGTGCTLDITASGGIVTVATINAVGTGYSDGDILTITGGTLPCTLTANTEIVAGKPICGHTVFYKSGFYHNEFGPSDPEWLSDEGWTVAKCSTAVWLDISGAGDFRPIAIRTEGEEYFAPMGGRLYMSNGVDYNIRWDGNFYCVGTAKCNAGTTVTGVGTAWSTYLDPVPSIAPAKSIASGDTMFFKIGGIWSTTPYKIVNAGATTTITLTGNGPQTGSSGATAVEYIIVRTHYMGVSGQAGSLLDGGNALTGSMEPGSYYYRYTMYNTRTGFESEPSPASAEMRVNGANGAHAATISAAGTGYIADEILPTTVAPTGGTYATVHVTAVDAGDGHINAWHFEDEGQGYGISDVLTILGGNGDATLTLTGLTATAQSHQRVTGIPASPLYYGVLTDPTDYQVDEVRVYRTKKNAAIGSPYYRIDPTGSGFSLLRDQTGFTFLSYYDDKIADAALGAELATTGYHTTPPILKFMYQHGGRMYGFGNSTYPNRLYFSTIDAAEWFPLYVFGSDTVTTNSLGGYVSIGDGIAEEITAIVPEGGAYIQSGEIGGDLLVFTTNKANRWHGSDWSDFSRTDAFGIGCTATRSALNCSGTIVWLSSDGVKSVQSGSNQPVTISNKLKADIPDNLSTGYVGGSAAAYWRDWYVLSVPLGSSTVNNKTYFLHMPTGTVYEGNDNASSYCVWNGPGDSGQLYYGSTTVGKLYQYKPTTYLSAAAEWTSKLMDFADKPDAVYMPFHIRKIILCWVAPATTQTYTLNIYSNGDTGTVQKQYTGQSVSAVGSTVTGRRYVVVDPSINARSVQLKVSGTFSAEMILEWIRIEYQREGVQPGTKVGS